MSATVATLGPFARPAAAADVERSLRRSLQTRNHRQNWALYLFVLLVPLQNIHTEYLPNLGGGLNFLNVMFFASLLMAWRTGGRLVHGTGINGWMLAYMAAAFIALLVGHAHVIDTTNHGSLLKDHLIALSFVFLAQMSTTDWGSVRRLLLLSLLPLPYMAYVVYDQHSAVSSWHYDHSLRISGTFALLGANEFAAFCTTAALLLAGLLLTLRASWTWRLVLAVAALAAGIGVVLTYSRTAYVAALVGLGLILVLRHRRAQLIGPVFAALLLAPAVLPYSVIERFQSIEVDEDSADKSTTDRFVYWGIAMKRFTENPVMGVGFHAFHHAEINPHRTDTHNFFLRELAEKGIVGLVVLLGLLLAVWRLLWRQYRRTLHGSWSHALALGLLGAMVAMGINNLFGDRFTYYPMVAHFWLYIGLAMRAVALQREQLRQGTAPVPAVAPGRHRLALVNRWNPPLAHLPEEHP
jgi:O-antigen ligase